MRLGFGPVRRGKGIGRRLHKVLLLRPGGDLVEDGQDVLAETGGVL